MDKTLIYLGSGTLAAYLFLTLTRPHAAAEGLESSLEMLLQATPWIIVSMFSAGLISELVDPALIARFFGTDSGLFGIFVAALLGALGTGSRWAMYPLAAGLLAADATPGAVFAFMTSWQLVSVTRLPAELPFLGLRFTVYRTVISILMAFVGGVLFDIVWAKFPPEH
ncbi:permease [Alicyclobacillus fastidiosus]|uniref:Permease n=1 Tax=Alicyclobacillus fastidiosus TaxID=392011 RepID=A0ABV5AGF4_9BACL|nr:permease [Alicyclobacillus fastidiosus]WEH12060.1 permease [Alicyclobacillus fastidiosus]